MAGWHLGRGVNVQVAFRREACDEKRRRFGPFGIALKESRVGRTGRQIARRWRLQALHAPALLVDQDQHLIAANRVADIVNEWPDQCWISDVAGKQDHARGLHL